MSTNRERLRLDDIVANIDRINSYIEHLSFQTFAADMKTADAVERCLQRVTEAAIKIGNERMAIIAPDVPMHEVRGMGNSLRHGYNAIDLETVWATVVERLPPLRAACLSALG